MQSLKIILMNLIIVVIIPCICHVELHVELVDLFLEFLLPDIALLLPDLECLLLLTNNLQLVLDLDELALDAVGLLGAPLGLALLHLQLLGQQLVLILRLGLY